MLGRSVVEFCAERGLCGGNTYFEYRSSYKYTRVARGQYGVEIKSRIDLVLVKKDMLRDVQDLGTVRGIGRSLSNHNVVRYIVRLVGQQDQCFTI